MKQTVSVIITDLDNTLWDWVEIWHRPFKALLDRLVQDSGVPQDQLLSDFKQVHTKHGTSEYAFSLEELPSLLKKHTAAKIPTVYSGAIEAYRDARREVLTLYPNVRETLERIKDHGAIIVGYTESLAFYTRYRLLKFDLDRTLDFLYSPADHDLPRGLTPDAIRKYSSDHYQLRRSVHRHTPPGKHKPSPEVLLQILRDIGASADECIYVGDKLVKDVAMAQAAGVKDVYAAYGDAHSREDYELLRKVTHWTGEAVRKEKETTPEQVNPSYVLHKSIAELHDHFEFVPFVDRSEQKVSHVIKAWAKGIEVQQHFNEIEMKIRNYVITLVIAVLGAASLAVKEGLPDLAVWIARFGCGGVVLFWMMDALWYHRLLIGAVNHTRWIEKRFGKHFPELGLSEAIGKASPINLRILKIRSTHKLWAFYALMFLLLLGAALGLPRLLSMKGPEVTQANIEQKLGSVEAKLNRLEAAVRASGKGQETRARNEMGKRPSAGPSRLPVVEPTETRPAIGDHAGPDGR